MVSGDLEREFQHSGMMGFRDLIPTFEEKTQVRVDSPVRVFVDPTVECEHAIIQWEFRNLDPLMELLARTFGFSVVMAAIRAINKGHHQGAFFLEEINHAAYVRMVQAAENLGFFGELVSRLNALKELQYQSLLGQVGIISIVNLSEAAATEIRADLILAPDLPTDYTQRVVVSFRL